MRDRKDVVENHYQLGLRLQKLRKQNRLTQQQLGDMVGIDRAYISRIERGVSNPSIDLLTLIAHGMNISPAMLLLDIACPPDCPYKLCVVPASDDEQDPKYRIIDF